MHNLSCKTHQPCLLFTHLESAIHYYITHTSFNYAFIYLFQQLLVIHAGLIIYSFTPDNSYLLPFSTNHSMQTHGLSHGQSGPISHLTHAKTSTYFHSPPIIACKLTVFLMASRLHTQTCLATLLCYCNLNTQRNFLVHIWPLLLLP